MSITFADAHTPRIVTISDFLSRSYRARRDLENYADRLRQVTVVVRPLHHRVALQWFDDYRMYCFEQNPDRWPDGRYYLLDRGYEHWRGHRIAFTHEQLFQIEGMREWNQLRQVGDNIFVCLQDDSWRTRFRGARLRQYVSLITKIAAAFELRPQP